MGVLGRALFEQGDDAYGNAALDLVREAGTARLPPIPQFAKDEALRVISRAPDAKIVSKYGDSLIEAFGVSFRFTTAESWEDLDAEHAERLLDAGLRAVRQQHIDTGTPDPLDPADPFCRVHYPTLGLVGTHPAFSDLRDYTSSRAAYQRLETLDDVHLDIGLAAGGVKKRHAQAFMSAQVLAWRVGRALGILDLLGELPRP